MVLHKICDIPVTPFLEELGVAILALRKNPHIEALSHYHHTE